MLWFMLVLTLPVLPLLPLLLPHPSAIPLLYPACYSGVGQVLMLDLDVHQGDGSATIFAGR